MSKPEKEKIIEIEIWGIENEAPDVKTITFDKLLPEARPGQFLMAGLYPGGEKPFSLSSKMSITLKRFQEKKKGVRSLLQKNSFVWNKVMPYTYAGLWGTDLIWRADILTS